MPVTYSNDKTSHSALAHTHRRHTPCGNGHCWHSYIPFCSSFQRILLGILEGGRTNKAYINPHAKLARAVATWNKDLAKGKVFPIWLDWGKKDLLKTTNTILYSLSKILQWLAIAVRLNSKLNKSYDLLHWRTACGTDISLTDFCSTRWPSSGSCNAPDTYPFQSLAQVASSVENTLPSRFPCLMSLHFASFCLSVTSLEIALALPVCIFLMFWPPNTH